MTYKCNYVIRFNSLFFLNIPNDGNNVTKPQRAPGDSERELKRFQKEPETDCKKGTNDKPILMFKIP